MAIHTPKEAALIVSSKIGNDPQPHGFTAGIMEGRHIPSGTFDEFVRCCESLGMVIHSYWVNETAIISGR